MGAIWRDLTYGFRTLRKNGGFTSIVVLILALGLGANTAIFSVLNSVILRPLPYPDADRLIMLRGSHFPDPMGEEVAIANLLDWRGGNDSFEHLGAYAPASVNLTGGDTPERIEAAQISPGAMAALGVQPVVGRMFLPEEEGPESRVVILGYGIWRSHFGGDPSVLGDVVRLSGTEFPIVGVMPPQFQFPDENVQIWIPLRITETRAADRQERWVYPFGRLKEGVSLSMAQADMDRVTAALAEGYPEFNKNWGVQLVPLHEHLVGDVRPALLILQVTVFLLLLLACANVANLQLARAASRQTEMAVRSAIGASSPAILRQLLIEGMVLAGLGALLGLLLAQWGLRLLIGLSPEYIPRLDEVAIDGTVLLFTLGVAALTGLAFGLVPARSALKRNLVEDLREGSTSASSGVGQIHFRRLLTVFEVIGSLVLMIGAGLLLSSLSHLQSIEPGFNPANLVTLELVLPRSRYSDGPQRAAFFREVTERTSRLPGVDAVGGTSSLPLSGSSASASYFVEDQPPPDPDDSPEANFQAVTPGYFQAMQIPLLRGRDFTLRDTPESPPAVIINRTFADLYWAGETAVGRRVFMMSEEEPLEVIGVVGDVHHMRLDQPPGPKIYVSYNQRSPWDSMVLVVRSQANTAPLVSRLRDEVWSMDPDQPISKVRTMETVLAASTSEPTLYTGLLMAFAALALVLATLGIYSVISYSVAQRQRELGIRIAMGAQHGDILTMVVREGITLTLLGVLAGLVLAWFAMRGIASQLVGVRPNDLLIFASTAVLLGVVSVLATIIPAIRASRANPMIAFRGQ